MLQLGDSRRQAQALLVGAERSAPHRALHAPEQLVGVLGGRLGEEHRELVTADPAGDVDGTDRVAQSVGRLGEHSVAGGVTDRVVDPLEVVYVEDDEGEVALVALRS